MELTRKIESYIEDHQQEAYDLLLELAQIPAPSNREERRTAFCRAWLEAQGAEDVYMDDALNVIYPIGVNADNPLVCFVAHSDVVFPDTEKLPLTVADGKIYCPGIGDDTANVVALMMAAKYIAEHKLQTKDRGLLLVINSGEEGLGNLKGTRKLMEDFGHRIQEFIAFDAHDCQGVGIAVGSRRYKIEIDTEGGHSFTAFGNRNAIAYLASLVDTLYTIKVPQKGKTTYNVGTISGGTSVNTIAQHAEMLYEFRSDERESLEIMDRHLQAAVEFYRTKGIQVTVTPVGDRPCGGDVDMEKVQAMMDWANEASVRHYGRPHSFGRGSTDCNIPLSMGIPSICVGCYNGDKSHTREEWVEIDSLLPGLKFAFDLILHNMEEET